MGCRRLLWDVEGYYGMYRTEGLTEHTGAEVCTLDECISSLLNGLGLLKPRAYLVLPNHQASEGWQTGVAISGKNSI